MMANLRRSGSSLNGSILNPKVPLEATEIGVVTPKEKNSSVERSNNLVKSRWTFEYVLYSLYLFAFFVCYGFSVVSDASRTLARTLRVDRPRWKWLTMEPFNSVGYNGSGDKQWDYLDTWLGVLIMFLFFFIVGSRGVRWAFRGNNEIRSLHYYYVIVGLIFIAFLHGPPFYIPLFFIIINYIFVIYFVRYKISYNIFMTVMWILQIGLLFFNSYYGEYMSSHFAPKLSSWWPRRLRWEVVLNMSVLRMIAFNMDFYEATNNGITQQEKAVEKHDSKCVECAQIREANRGEGLYSTRCYKFRTEYSREIQEYNLLSYLAYMFYVPLYVAGPMSSFNAFISHCHHSTLVMSLQQKISYALRVFFIYIVLVIMLHFAFVNAFRQFPKAFLNLSIPQMALIFYYSLAFLWLKFSLIWKLSRLASCIDGIDVPEDMRRCFTNTVSVRDFWRDWHASFNLWIVRYMYIPMGGNKKKHLNIFPIFFFIAIWHDVSLHLIKWAACVVFIFILELLISALWNTRYCARLRRSRFQRFLRSVAGLFTVFGLIVANLVGFASQAPTGGGKGTDHTIHSVLISANFSFYFFTFLTLFCVASAAIVNRDVEAAEVLRLKRKYGFMN